MEELEKKLGYTFRDPELLRAALYHSSYANEHRSEGIRSNERLGIPGRCRVGLCVRRAPVQKAPGAAGGRPDPHPGRPGV